jgi:hypothetical protein
MAEAILAASRSIATPEITVLAIYGTAGTCHGREQEQDDGGKGSHVNKMSY